MAGTVSSPATLASETNGLRKPNLFLIGAPKCGTTSLANWLSEHPRIFFSKIKEPHYFHQESIPPVFQPKNPISKAHYESLFADATDAHSFIAEASTSYLVHGKHVIPKILEYNPASKFLICLRNPVEMVVSWHSELLWAGEEDKLRFIDAWSLHEQRRKGLHLPPFTTDPVRADYDLMCRLGDQVRTVLNVAPRKSVAFVFQEDMHRAPEQTYLDVLTFLGLEADGPRDFQPYNQRKARKSQWVKRATNALMVAKLKLGIKRRFGILKRMDELNRSAPKRTTIDPPIIEMLQNNFAQDIRLLSQLVGRDLDHWLERSAAGAQDKFRGAKARSKGDAYTRDAVS